MCLILGFTNVGSRGRRAVLVIWDSTALFCHLGLQPSVDEYMGMTKRSPSPPEACRSQILPDWGVQQPNAGECGCPALELLGFLCYGRRDLPL